MFPLFKKCTSSDGAVDYCAFQLKYSYKFLLQALDVFKLIYSVETKKI